MVINFILPSSELYGGIRAVVEISNILNERGHEVNTIIPVINKSYENLYDGKARYFLKRIIKYGKIKKERSNFDWIEYEGKIVNIPHMKAASMVPMLVPDADATIATAWQTSFFVNDLPSSKGEKFYFVQHFETWDGPEKRVKKTYSLPTKIITTSSYLKNKLSRNGYKVHGQVMYGASHETFYEEKLDKENSKNIRIGIMYSGRSWKGSEDGMRAYKRVNENVDEELQLVLFGKRKPKTIPSSVEFYEDPSQPRLREIYNSLDMFVMPSHHEGFGMPPMEAMACGTACVVTDVGGVPDYTVPGETALVVQPKNIDQMSRAIRALVTDKAKRKSIASAGYDYIQDFTWESCGEKFESLLHRTLE